MSVDVLRGQKLRDMVFELWKSQEFERQVNQLKGIGVQRVISPLFAALCSDDEVKGHAVTSMGILISDLAE